MDRPTATVKWFFFSLFDSIVVTNVSPSRQPVNTHWSTQAQNAEMKGKKLSNIPSRSEASMKCTFGARTCVLVSGWMAMSFCTRLRCVHSCFCRRSINRAHWTRRNPPSRTQCEMDCRAYTYIHCEKVKNKKTVRRPNGTCSRMFALLLRFRSELCGNSGYRWTVNIEKFI